MSMCDVLRVQNQAAAFQVVSTSLSENKVARWWEKENLTHIYNIKGPFLTFLVRTHIAHRQRVCLNSPGSAIPQGTRISRRLRYLAGRRGKAGGLVCLVSTANALTIAKQRKWG